MKITAIADAYIPADMLSAGLEKLVDAGHEVTIFEWMTESIEKLQEANLDIEQHGPNSYELPGDISDAIKNSDAVITQFAPIGSDLINSCEKLKFIGVLRGGTENVDQNAADDASVKVINTPGRNARAVAEFAVGMILSECRNLARTHHAMKKNIWLKDFPNGADIPELEGKVLGVVGAGNIGQLVMIFMSGMDMTCEFFDPYTQTSKYGEKVETLEELASQADVLTIHSRLTSDNHHLVSEKILSLMKPTAVLVNTARSGLVDEKALIKALKEKKIIGAAIDTFDNEPLPADSAWLELENATITSHIAGSTTDAFRKTPILLSDRMLEAFKN